MLKLEAEIKQLEFLLRLVDAESPIGIGVS